MPWWGWLLIGALVTGVVVLIVLLLTRKKTVMVGLTKEEKDKLFSLDTARAEKDLEIEKEKSSKLQQVAVKLQASLDALNAELDAVKDKIDADKQKEFERLRDDGSAAGRELDELLGISRSDDTDPG